MIESHPNRLNARKNKTGGGCRMCKPWKHKWEHKFKKNVRVNEYGREKEDRDI